MTDELTGMRSAILALRYDWFDLEQQLATGTGQTLGITGRATPEGSAAPLNLGVLALQERIWWLTTAWEEPVREAAGLRAVPNRGVRPGSAVSRATGTLAEFLPTLLALGAVTFCGYPDRGDCDLTGPEGLDDLLQTHRLARQMLGLTVRSKHMYGPCPNCRREELRSDEPERARSTVTVYCGHCDHRMTESDYETHVRSLVVRL